VTTRRRTPKPLWPSATARRVRDRLKKKRSGYFFVWSRAVLTRWRGAHREPVSGEIGLVTLDGLPSRAPGATYRELEPPAVAPTQPRGWRWPQGFVPVPTPRAMRGQGVVEIPNGVVFGSRGYLGTDTHSLLADGCTFWDDHDRVALADAATALAVGVMPLEGLTVCAFAEGTNYAHTLLQSVPRLELFRRADALEGDRFLVNEGQRATLEALELLGIPAGRVHRVPLRDAPVYQTEWLRAATSMNTWDFGVGWSAEFLNAVFLPDPPEPDASRRLYVPRGTTRRAVLNEDDVVAMLEPRGFEVVTMDGRSISEQAAMFASASVIVAPHGAALANLVFARPGTVVVELMGTNTASGLYPVLSWRRRLDHRVIMGTEPAPPPRWWTWRMDADTIVDVRALQRCLDGLALQ
jgi:Glycosyltransferase 61